MQIQLELHYLTQHYITLITLHYNCNYHYIALHDTTLQLQLQLHYANYTTLQLQLTTTTPLHYNYI